MDPADVPDTLYHYTTLSGLRGILDSGRLWATDAFFLNDSKELTFGAETLRTALAPFLIEDQSKLELDKTKMVSAARAGAAIQLIDRLILGNNSGGRRVFVASLCEDGDLLSQWRGYGPGGYSVGIKPRGFEGHDLVRGIPKGSNTYYNRASRLRLRKVTYGAPTLASLSELVRAVVPADGLTHVNRGHTFLDAQEAALEAVAIQKHEAFQEEKEWRVIAVRSSQGERLPKLCFRPSDNTFGTPYVELPLILRPPTRANPDEGQEGGLVAEIVVGPGGDMDSRHQSLVAWLMNNNLGHVRVRNSAAPFRG